MCTLFCLFSLFVNAGIITPVLRSVYTLCVCVSHSLFALQQFTVNDRTSLYREQVFVLLGKKFGDGLCNYHLSRGVYTHTKHYE